MKNCKIYNRSIVRISGVDKIEFLQGLVSNDMTKLTPDNPIYACLLTPQGKFLHDFIMTVINKEILLEVEADRAESLIKTLKIYSLRKDVEIDDCSDKYAIFVAWGKDDDTPKGFYQDPRHEELGFRIVTESDIECNAIFEEYDHHRIMLSIPDGSRDMPVKFATLLDYGIDKLNGISWDKGCYTGQELTARMKYRGTIKKRLIVVTGDNLLPPESDITNTLGHTVGKMCSSCGDVGLALLKISAIENGDTFFNFNILLSTLR